LIEIERTFARGIVGSEGYLVLKGIERSEDWTFRDRDSDHDGKRDNETESIVNETDRIRQALKLSVIDEKGSKGVEAFDCCLIVSRLNVLRSLKWQFRMDFDESLRQYVVIKVFSGVYGLIHLFDCLICGDLSGDTIVATLLDRLVVGDGSGDRARER
jgi:hypothetical protein